VDTTAFDRLTRRMASRLSRRSVIRNAAAGTAAGSAGALLAASADADGKDKNKARAQGNNDRCRAAGQPCEGNQRCCPGLTCGNAGPGARRCLPIGDVAGGGTDGTGNTIIINSSANASASAGGVEQDASVTAGAVAAGALAPFGTVPALSINVTCTYEAAAFQSVCVALGGNEMEWPAVTGLELPFDGFCAVLIDRVFQPPRFEEIVRTIPGGGGGGQASAGTGGTANADASGGTVSIGDVNSGGNTGGNNDTNISVDASGGNAVADASGGDNNVAIAGSAPDRVVRELRQVAPAELRIVLEGNVAPVGRTTWWLETDQGRLPASGPSLARTEEITPATGAIAVSAFACPGGGADQAAGWFGRCTEAAAPLDLRLTPASGGDAMSRRLNDLGRTRFEALAPGRYRFEIPAGSWCHAESDSFDAATGELIVEAGRESNVWFFTCP
jgi:hypothetical protein